MKSRKFSAIFNSPATEVIIYAILLVATILELYETTLENILNIEIKIHHGIILFSLVKIFEAAMDLITARKEMKELAESKMNNRVE